jgi:hypothetical protein
VSVQKRWHVQQGPGTLILHMTTVINVHKLLIIYGFSSDDISNKQRMQAIGEPPSEGTRSNE